MIADHLVYRLVVESTMVILNNSDQTYDSFDLSFCQESLEGYTSGVDIISGKKLSTLSTMNLKPNQAYIVELNKN